MREEDVLVDAIGVLAGRVQMYREYEEAERKERQEKTQAVNRLNRNGQELAEIKEELARLREENEEMKPIVVKAHEDQQKAERLEVEVDGRRKVSRALRNYLVTLRKDIEKSSTPIEPEWYARLGEMIDIIDGKVKIGG